MLTGIVEIIVQFKQYKLLTLILLHVKHTCCSTTFLGTLYPYLSSCPLQSRFISTLALLGLLLLVPCCAGVGTAKIVRWVPVMFKTTKAY